MFHYQVKDSQIHYLPQKTYHRLAIKFLNIYGSKLLKLIVGKKRQGHVDHEILTLHLDWGVWSIIDGTKSNIQAFMDEPLSCAEERFNVIDRSFILLLDDFKKLALYFKENDKDLETIKNLSHLSKLIPSLLVE